VRSNAVQSTAPARSTASTNLVQILHKIDVVCMLERSDKIAPYVYICMFPSRLHERMRVGCCEVSGKDMALRQVLASAAVVQLHA
jgi:hypothetical protein